MGSPAKAKLKRKLLRDYMEDCPACGGADEADYVKDEDLDKWLDSHDKDWRA
jgi:hypothetical protein